jgi:hypothetical protein
MNEKPMDGVKRLFCAAQNNRLLNLGNAWVFQSALSVVQALMECGNEKKT